MDQAEKNRQICYCCYCGCRIGADGGVRREAPDGEFEIVCSACQESGSLPDP